jgi:hypothetical protein
MAIIAKINSTGTIGRATVKNTGRTFIVAPDFTPKVNVSLAELNDVTGAETIQNGQTLVYNSASGKYEANTISVPVLNGGDF